MGETSEPKPDPELLMEMLEQREALAEARATRDVAAVRGAGRGDRSVAHAEASSGAVAGLRRRRRSRRIASLLPTLGELRFYRRFLDEVSAIEDELAA